MPILKRGALVAVCALCAAETVAIIAYYGAPLIRTTLAGLIGIVVIIGIGSALRVARRGELVRHYHRGDPSGPEREAAPVYYLPHAFTTDGEDAVHGDANEKDPRVVHLDSTRPVTRPRLLDP